MFFKKNHKPQNRIDTLIGASTVIEGDIEFSGGLRIDGTVRGHVTEISAEPGMLILSEQGHIDGTINVSHALLNGVVNGPVNASEYVELQAKAKITGDLRYKTLEMFVGAVVEGKLIHTGGAPSRIADDED